MIIDRDRRRFPGGAAATGALLVPRRAGAVALVALVACAAKAPPAAVEAPRRYGEVMSDIGRRFELLGRAANARRFELAAFELGEIEEAFADDLPRAAPPREGSPAVLPQLAAQWVATSPKELGAALRAHDEAAFSTSFAHAAALCNACHQASAHAFVEVPAVPGESVPALRPLPDRGRAP